MEDVSIRAITIGASVLIALATISAVFTYYSAAKDMVRQIGSGTDFAGLYEKSIEEILLKKQITGTELTNLLNYFDGRNDVEVNATNIELLSYSKADNMLMERNDLVWNKYSEAYSGKYLYSFIIPNSLYTIDNINMKDGVLTIEINGKAQNLPDPAL